MNIKLFLRDYPFINTELQRLQKELNELIKSKQETYVTLKAVSVTGMPKSTVPSDNVYSTVQVLVDRYDAKINYYTKQINNLLDEKELFEKAWFNRNLLSHEERAIIELRCFERYRWPDIARVLKYSEKQCQRLLDKVIEKLQCEVDELMKVS